jgi:hypothetical protein
MQLTSNTLHFATDKQITGAMQGICITAYTYRLQQLYRNVTGINYTQNRIQMCAVTVNATHVQGLRVGYDVKD